MISRKSSNTIEGSFFRVHKKRQTYLIMTAMVIESFDGNLYANILDHLFSLEEIPVRDVISKNFDTDVVEVKKKKPYIPPMSHPWKHAFYLAFVAKQKHRQSGANV